ncbi:MAG TPA: choice-of-anchor D domain-containing protein [Solirubrobacterales bacterium]|nr:choice-of-anchor D domain-containing protein [Solirubrobacterales bacterium]
MNHLTAGYEPNRLVLLPILAFVALLAAAAQAQPAPAAIVANPDPDLIARWEPCEAAPGPGAGVTVVVDRRTLADGKVYVGCAAGEQPSGWAAVQAAGFAVEGLGGGTGFACRIDGQPTPAEESCTATPGVGSYWSYWHGKPGGRWGYSGVGSANPLSAAGPDDVQGWSFGGGNAPRIEPLNGDGPSGFVLPPVQESSTIPAARARAWLPGALNETATLTESVPSTVVYGRLLTGAVALAGADADPADLEPLAEMLGESCESGSGPVDPCLRGYADPVAATTSSQRLPERLAAAVLGVEALGNDPSAFAGLNLRGALLEHVDEATGKVQRQSSLSDGLEFTSAVVEALAGTGTLSEKALKTLDLVLAKQNPTTGAFATGSIAQVKAIKALAAAKEAGVAGLDEELSLAGGFLETLQEADGSVRRNAGNGPTFESTAIGAVGLALAGRASAAEEAAKWVSRYQVTAEYVGAPDPVTWEPPPGDAVLGAFLPTESALRNAVNVGIPSPFDEAQEPTAQALLALVTAGPYGPFNATTDQESLWFGTLEVGSQSTPQGVTLTNHDVRSIEVVSAALGGDAAADFGVDFAACAGQTLDPGESCQLSAHFAPSAVGTREAVVGIALAGSDQVVAVSLVGAAVAAPGSDPGSDPEQQKDPQHSPPPGMATDPQSPSPPATGAKASPIARSKGVQTVGAGRLARIATLSCPPGASCAILVPGQVWVEIAGTRYRLAVLAPTTVRPGKRAALVVRLPRAALERLGGGRAVVEIPVTIEQQGRRTTRKVRVTIRGRAAAGAAPAPRRM